MDKRSEAVAEREQDKLKGEIFHLSSSPETSISRRTHHQTSRFPSSSPSHTGPSPLAPGDSEFWRNQRVSQTPVGRGKRTSPVNSWWPEHKLECSGIICFWEAVPVYLVSEILGDLRVTAIKLFKRLGKGYFSAWGRNKVRGWHSQSGVSHCFFWVCIGIALPKMETKMK